MCLQVAELKYKCLLISEETTVEDVIRYTATVAKLSGHWAFSISHDVN